MMFQLNSQLTTNTILLTEWNLSLVLLKNDQNYPWLILVPKQANMQEIHQLTAHHQALLIKEICRLSEMMQKYFQPDKLNIGALGNIVPQLHIHVVARYKNDLAWPHGVWQPNYISEPYSPEKLSTLIHDFGSLLL